MCNIRTWRGLGRSYTEYRLSPLARREAWGSEMFLVGDLLLACSLEVARHRGLEVVGSTLLLPPTLNKPASSHVERRT